MKIFYSITFARLLKPGIFALLCFLIACQSGREIHSEFGVLKKNNELPILAVLGAPEGDTGGTARELNMVADYAKIPMHRINLESFNAYGKLKPSVRTVCLSESLLLSDRAIDSLHAFVAKGGTLFLTSISADARMAFLMGMNPSYTFEENLESYGYSFHKNLYPNAKGKSLTGYWNAHGGINGENLSDGIDVLAFAANSSSYPALYTNKIGSGKVIVHNSKLDFTKATRGVLFASLLLGLEGIPYPVASVASIQLDEFPSPINPFGNLADKSIKTPLVSDFVSEVWWPDMKSLANKHQLKYTAFPVFSDNFANTPPFDFTEWDNTANSKLTSKQPLGTWLGKDALKAGHELGFSGYNSVSLSKKNWDNQKHMVKALNAAVKKWGDEAFGNAPMTYSPPQSSIDSMGLSILEQTVPSLRYIQSYYYGDFDKGGNREFSPEPLNHHFFNFPRMSNGFKLTGAKQAEIGTSFLYTGIWTHVVNPNRVYQESQFAARNTSAVDINNLRWHSNDDSKGLLDSFDEELRAFKNRYPLVRFVSAKEGSEIASKWRYAKYQHSQEEGLFTVFSDDYSNEGAQENYWFVYVSKENDAPFGFTIDEQTQEFHKSEVLNGYLYQIKTDEAFITVPDVEIANNDLNEFMMELVNEERKLFYNDNLEQVPYISALEDLMVKGEYAAASNLMESQVINGKPFTAAQWLKYADLMMVQNKAEGLWSFLERDYLLNKQKKKVFNALQIGERHEFPNDEVKKIWYDRAMAFEIGGVPLLREYLVLVAEDNNTKKKKEILRKLADKSELEQDGLNYVLFMLENGDAEVLQYLESIPYCAENYSDISYEIAWFLADNFKYDEALGWANCAMAITSETKKIWYDRSNHFEELKDNDPVNYYGILINRNPDRAVKELSQLEICSGRLTPIADKIAIIFGDYGSYRGALSWAECAEGIPVEKLLKWNYAMNQYTQMTNLYEKYMERNPKDVEMQYYMANLYLNIGAMESTAAIAQQMPEGNRLNDIKYKLNKNIVYVGQDLQYEIISKYPDLFNEETKADVRENARLEIGNDIFFLSESEANDFDPTVLKFLGGYSLNDKKKNVHALSVIRGYVYAIDNIGQEPTNAERDLLGLEYEFMNPRGQNLDFRISGRVEGDDTNDTYFQLKTHLGYTKEKSSYVATAAYKPVQTGPGYVQGLYTASLKGAAAYKIGERLGQTTTLKANYFTDEEFSGSLSSQWSFALVNEVVFKVKPLAEASYGTATIDRRTGFPYWAAKDRFIAGPGLGITLGDNERNYFINASASWFYENNDNPSFERYSGQFNFTVLKYFDVNAGLDVYTIDNFFLNSYSFGIRYHLKPFKYAF